MAGTSRRLVVAVRTGGSPGRAGEVLRWLRALVPAAVLLVSPGPADASAVDLAAPDGDEVITIDADAVRSGPLSLAAALVRAHVRP